ncbi:MAG: hypothetical protein WC955_11495 [Elusimicrobiota bacterium]
MEEKQVSPNEECNAPKTGSECGPGCSCSAPVATKSNKTKIVVGSLIALVAISIFAYKMINAKSVPASENTGTYSAVEETSKPKETVSAVIEKNTTEVGAKKIIAKNIEVKTFVGEKLDSLNSLNNVAMDRDAVFVFIPMKDKEEVTPETETAMLNAQRTLKTSKINVGMYTLPASSPDHKEISAQIPSLPAVLIACKGRGMNVVYGDVTETKIVQAFAAAAQAGGCGSSGCGPSSSGCK